MTTCPHCRRELACVGGLPFCPHCNDSRGEFYNTLSRTIDQYAQEADMVLIECPGATLYHSGTDKVSTGVRFFDPEKPSSGYEIVDKPVFGPKHVSRRWVKKQDAHLIRRCQSCQDHTIRMRRKEGPNLYIPSRRHPRTNHRQSEIKRA